MNPLGVSSYFGYRSPLPERAARIARAGFTHTTLWWGEYEQLYRAGRAEQMPDILRGANLQIANLHAPFEESNQLWSPEASERRKFVDRHRGLLGVCARHAVDRMVLHVTHTPTAPSPTPEGIEAFGELVREAEAAQVTLAIENTRKIGASDALLRAYDSPRVGYCWDSGHDWLWCDPPLRTLRDYAGRLVETHLADVIEGVDRHLLPGDGQIAWDRVSGAFPDDYEGPILLEVLPQDTSPWAGPDALLAEALRRARWLRGLLKHTPAKGERF